MKYLFKRPLNIHKYDANRGWKSIAHVKLTEPPGLKPEEKGRYKFSKTIHSNQRKLQPAVHSKQVVGIWSLVVAPAHQLVLLAVADYGFKRRVDY
jgi:hypothetical protein